MTESSPDAQTLSDRLARMDPVRRNPDRRAVERALREHLARFGWRRRRFVWIDDPGAARTYVAERRQAETLAPVLTVIDIAAVVIRMTLMAVGWGAAAFVAAMPIGFFISWVSGDRTGIVLRANFGAPTVAGTLAIGALLGCLYGVAALLVVRATRRRHAAARPLADRLRIMRPFWDAATLVVLGDDSEVFVVGHWRHVRNAIPFAAHNEAHSEILTSLVGRRRFPMTESFAAGLFLFWVLPREVVCVPPPAQAPAVTTPEV